MGKPIINCLAMSYKLDFLSLAREQLIEIYKGITMSVNYGIFAEFVQQSVSGQWRVPIIVIVQTPR